VPSDRLHVIPNGVAEIVRDEQTRKRMRQALGLDESVFVCLYVGRLEAVKDLGTLLAGVAKLSDTIRRHMRVYLAGDGSERSALEASSRSLRLEGTVTFLGARSDVPDLLSMADAFVMSSRTEGLPMALIESMAAGLPCVATAVGGIPAVLSEGCGISVPPGNPQAIAEALTELAQDSRLRRQLGELASRKIRSEYGLQPVVTSYLRLMGLPASWPSGA
jgi:glycosyltransferase involved in cell wall biosynthesis